HQVAGEILRQGGGHRAHGAGGGGLAHQRQGELVGAHGQALVLLRDREQVLQPPRELGVLVAQHLQLVAGQRGGGAVIARHHQAQRQIGELLQELRVPAQPGGDFVGAALLDGLVHPIHSPSNTNAAGPAIIMGWPGPGHAICRVPPGSRTSISRPTRPRRMSTAAAAQAPLPQARVSPTPRSNTRSCTLSRPSTWAKPTLAESGNAPLCCSAGPNRSTGAWSTSSTSITACGLPIETAPNSTGIPPRSSTYGSSPSPNPSSGMAEGVKSGSPMATRTRPSSRRPTRWLPARRASTQAGARTPSRCRPA